MAAEDLLKLQRRDSHTMPSMGTENLETGPVSGGPRLSPVDWNKRVEALARGWCSEEEFISELWLHGQSAPDLPWEVAALLDQNFRRGNLRADIFRSTASNIARHQLTAERKVALTLLNAPQTATTTVPTPTTGETFPVKQQLSVGDVLRERYVIDSYLGTGGMGTVYKAVDRFRQEHGEIDCHVAIKVLHEGTHERPAALARLRCEFYCAQMLSHPNVINVFDLDRDGDLDFFTMEWLDGELLSSVLHQFGGKPMPRAAAWAIIRQIAEGIAHAHERNIVHADLKPQNIMLLKSGQVRILDFGASSGGPRGLEADHPPRNQLALTPAYASCELLTGKLPDRRDDLYALSCLACELLAGQHPFWHQRSTAARMAQAVPTRPAHLSDRQWRALLQGLAWDREHRSIQVRDWLAIVNPQPVALHEIPRPQPVEAPSPPSKLSATRIMAALGVFFACLCAWALFNREVHMGVTDSLANSAEVTPGASAAASWDSSEPGAELTRGSDPAAAHLMLTASLVPTGDSETAAQNNALSKDAEGHRPTVRAAREIELASASYRIPPGANFAEVKVRRASAGDQSSFEWWTEGATAMSGVDFVPQLPAKVTFERGSRTATLFVKLLPDSARKQSAKFDVVIGGASKGTLVGLARTQVVLAPVVVASGSAGPAAPIS
jgi:Protein kinase domain